VMALAGRSRSAEVAVFFQLDWPIPGVAALLTARALMV
jgi:hypothetical protein